MMALPSRWGGDHLGLEQDVFLEGHHLRFKGVHTGASQRSVLSAVGRDLEKCIAKLRIFYRDKLHLRSIGRIFSIVFGRSAADDEPREGER